MDQKIKLYNLIGGKTLEMDCTSVTYNTEGIGLGSPLATNGHYIFHNRAQHVILEFATRSENDKFGAKLYKKTGKKKMFKYDMLGLCYKIENGFVL
jgi:hypothetical protein